MIVLGGHARALLDFLIKTTAKCHSTQLRPSVDNWFDYYYKYIPQNLLLWNNVCARQFRFLLLGWRNMDSHSVSHYMLYSRCMLTTLCQHLDMLLKSKSTTAYQILSETIYLLQSCQPSQLLITECAKNDSVAKMHNRQQRNRQVLCTVTPSILTTSNLINPMCV